MEGRVEWRPHPPSQARIVITPLLTSYRLQVQLRCSTSRACCGWTAGRASRHPPALQASAGELCGAAACAALPGCNGTSEHAVLAPAMPTSCPHVASFPSYQARQVAIPAVLVRELRNEVSRLLAAKVRRGRPNCLRLLASLVRRCMVPCQLAAEGDQATDLGRHTAPQDIHSQSPDMAC